MPDTIPEQILTHSQLPPAGGRPIRKDEIELHDRGLYIESAALPRPLQECWSMH